MNIVEKLCDIHDISVINYLYKVYGNAIWVSFSNFKISVPSYYVEADIIYFMYSSRPPESVIAFELALLYNPKIFLTFLYIIMLSFKLFFSIISSVRYLHHFVFWIYFVLSVLVSKCVAFILFNTDTTTLRNKIRTVELGYMRRCTQIIRKSITRTKEISERDGTIMLRYKTIGKRIITTVLKECVNKQRPSEMVTVRKESFRRLKRWTNNRKRWRRILECFLLSLAHFWVARD